MFEILLNGSLGALAGVFAVLVARAFVDRKKSPQRFRYLTIALMIVAFQISKAVLKPRLYSWRHSRAVDAELQDDPFLHSIVEDDPALEAPIRAALLRTYSRGDRAVGFSELGTILSSMFLKYLPKGSDETVLGFTRSFLHTLRKLEAGDPDRCYRYLYPDASGPPNLTEDEGKNELYAAMTAVAESARGSLIRKDVEPETRALLQATVVGLRERPGMDLDVLREPRKPEVDRAKVCRMAIELYAEILTLPPDKAAGVVRFMFAQ